MKTCKTRKPLEKNDSAIWGVATTAAMKSVIHFRRDIWEDAGWQETHEHNEEMESDEAENNGVTMNERDKGS